MAAIAALFTSAADDHTGQQLARAQALKLSNAYESRGHGGKTPRVRTGIPAVRRAALKRRNKLRHRKACRG